MRPGFQMRPRYSLSALDAGFVMRPAAGGGRICLRRGLCRQLVVGVVLAGSLGGRAQANLHTDPLNFDPLVKQAYDRFYNLDFDGALKINQELVRLHPNDPMVWNYELTTLIFRELYHQDLLDTTYYAHDSFLTTKREIDIAPAVRNQIEDLTTKAIATCDAALKTNPKDANAYFARGYAKGIHAAFLVLADHAFAAAARQGYAARNDSEQALKIDPGYADADMAIGIQQFAVASLPGWVRMIVGIMGVGGNKEKGLAMIREAVAHGVVTPVESRTILSLFLRHDGRYPEALAVQRELGAMYPHDYLYRLEVANLLKDEGHGLEAIAAYQQVIADAQKPGYFVDPRLQLAWFGMADTQRGYNDVKAAAYGYTQAATQPKCSDWLRKRAELYAGEMHDLLHERDQALTMYRLVLAPGGDQTQADTARRLMKTPFMGK
jgi:tetratricopeptide (TPR) repeat protein